MRWAMHLQRRCDRHLPVDVISTDDIDKILDRPERDSESIPEWCRRNDVDESVIRRLAAVYGYSRQIAALAIDAFRLGYEARRGDEPRSKSSPARDGRRYAVEFVVIDRDDGRIVGDPNPAQDDAEGLAGAYNEIDAQARRASRDA
jgi:hypothetical protein